MAEEDPKVIVSFKKCPVCGSTKRLAEMVYKEQESPGSQHANDMYALYPMAFVLVHPDRAKSLVLGSKVPEVTALFDVCIDCGTTYAVQVLRREVRVMPNAQMPGPRGKPFVPFRNN